MVEAFGDETMVMTLTLVNHLLLSFVFLLYAGHGGCVESAEESAVFNSVHDALAVFNCGELSIADSCASCSLVSCKS